MAAACSDLMSVEKQKNIKALFALPFPMVLASGNPAPEFHISFLSQMPDPTCAA